MEMTILLSSCQEMSGLKAAGTATWHGLVEDGILGAVLIADRHESFDAVGPARKWQRAALNVQ